MIEIKDKKDCYGCHACEQVCARNCITMQADNEGFLYPIVDKEACNNCGLCEKVCPAIHQDSPRAPLAQYIAINRNEAIRLNSSSGGIFTLLAEKVINDGGVVFGARFNENWNVVHTWTDTLDRLDAFRGSKYVQSHIGDSYREAREFLKQGRKVLFSGTPCQIAGLRRYLRNEYDNLFTVDIVCHGVPSPGVWHRYLDEFRDTLRSEYNEEKGLIPSSANKYPIITGISFRDKTNGWKKFSFRLRYRPSAMEEERDFLQPFVENPFMQGFLVNINLRPSCHACSAKSGKSGSDVTIADAWGLNQFAPEHDDDKGACYVLENTEKGRCFLRQLQFDCQPIGREVVKSYISLYSSSVKSHPKRLLFFREYAKKDKTIESIVLQLLTPTYLGKLIWSIKHRLAPIKNRLFKPIR